MSITNKGYEYEGMWYPTKISLIESIGTTTHQAYYYRLKKGLSHNEALFTPNKHSNGFNLRKYCKDNHLSYNRVATLVYTRGVPLEEALHSSPKRIIKHAINNTVKRNSDWAKHFNICPKKFNNHINDKGFKKALEYFSVDTSDMEIYPCDGDVIMYHDKRYNNQN